MAKSNRVFILCFFVAIQTAFAQQQTYLLTFTDKASNSYSVSNPQQFLTDRALSRRAKCQVAVTENDVPVSQTYIDQVKAQGAQVLYALKWFNAVVVRSDATVKTQLQSLPFVASADHSIKSRQGNPFAGQSMCEAEQITAIDYGTSLPQNSMLGIPQMHSDGYDGSGILIAVTDDGFLNVNTLSAFAPLFSSNRIIDVWDIVDFDKDVYAQGGHGTHVFSVLAGNAPGQFVGPGFGANYLLFRTEDLATETPLEELNWVRAAEMADSLGADVIQTSLGYNTFDDPSLDYTINDLDGNTAYISKGVNLAFEKGILVVNSAGNSGDKPWKKILSPADAEGALSVGAVDGSEIRAAFSSVGKTADGRIKPDVMAMGQSTVIVRNTDGVIITGSGTSFAAPQISGLAAGLLQAYPNLTHAQIKQAIIVSGDRHNTPDSLYGHGIPNYTRAANYAMTLGIQQGGQDQKGRLLFPNPMEAQVYLKTSPGDIGYTMHWKLSAANGQVLKEGDQLVTGDSVLLINEAKDLPAGMYIVTVSGVNDFSTFKLIK